MATIIGRDGKRYSGSSSPFDRGSSKTNNSRTRPTQTAGSSGGSSSKDRKEEPKQTARDTSPMAQVGAANEQFGGSVTKEDVAERASKTVYPKKTSGGGSSSKKDKVKVGAGGLIETKNPIEEKVKEIVESGQYFAARDVSPQAAKGSPNTQFGGTVKPSDKEIVYSKDPTEEAQGKKKTAVDRIKDAFANPFKPISQEWESAPEDRERWITNYIENTYVYDKVTGDIDDIKDRVTETTGGVTDGINEAIEGAKEAADGVKEGVNNLLAAQRKLFVAAVIVAIGYIVAKVLFAGKTVKTAAAANTARRKDKK